MDNKEYLLKFRGGTLAAFIPLLVFCVGTVFICVTWFSLDFNGIAMMAILGLIVGSLFCKNFNEYWEAAGRGMADHVCIYTLLILFVVGMFGALIKASNLSNGFVWLPLLVRRIIMTEKKRQILEVVLPHVLNIPLSQVLFLL